MEIQRLQSNKIWILGSWAQWVFFFVFALVYLRETCLLASYAPYLDDYEAFLNFLISVETEPVFTKKLGYLFQQHNEHRIVIPRLIVWLQYFITGELNLKATLLIGNLFLVAAVFVLLKYFFSKKGWGINCAAIFLLFNYMHFENFQWALASLQNYGVILMSLVSFVFCSKQHYKTMFLFAFLAALCSSTGILLFGCYMLYFLAAKKYYFSGLCFLFLLLIYLGFYGINYQSIHSHPGSTYMIRHPGEVLQYYFILSVSYLSPFFRSLPWVAVLFGILMLPLNFFAMTKLWLKDRLHIFIYVNLFMYLVLIAITITRFNFGADQAFASRYIIFSVIYFLLTFSMIAETNKSKGIILKSVLGGLLILFSMYHAYYALSQYKLYVKGVKNHLDNTLCLHKAGGNPILPYIGKNDPNEILRKAEQLNLFRLDRINCN